MTTVVPPAMGPDVGKESDMRNATMWSITGPSEEWTLLEAERSLPLQVTAIDAKRGLSLGAVQMSELDVSQCERE